jgi:hypothetical protein
MSHKLKQEITKMKSEDLVCHLLIMKPFKILEIVKITLKHILLRKVWKVLIKKIVIKLV